jgi:hypothetical protein
MINDIYRKYFQKSFTFLFPLLGFKKRFKFKPVQTYIAWEGVYDKDSRKLICIYNREDSEQWRAFEREHLISHKMLDYCLPFDENSVIYVFDFNIFKDDFDHFINGKYSKMSKHAKQLLTDYYGIHTPEWVFIESYLFPESYFNKYAEILEIDVKELIKVGELCDMYNPEKETCTIKHPEIHLT